jgi:hypothetical protein
MPTLLCTGKYRKTFGLPEKLTPATIDEGALGPWYANTLNVGPQRLLHFMSAPSLLSVVITLRERSTTEQRFVRALNELLHSLGVEQRYIELEETLFASVTYGRSSDRSKLGSLRDQGDLAWHYVADGRSIHDVNIRLSITPCGPMGYDNPASVAPARLKAQWQWQRG